MCSSILCEAAGRMTTAVFDGGISAYRNQCESKPWLFLRFFVSYRARRAAKLLCSADNDPHLGPQRPEVTRVSTVLRALRAALLARRRLCVGESTGARTATARGAWRLPLPMPPPRRRLQHLQQQHLRPPWRQFSTGSRNRSQGVIVVGMSLPPTR